MIRDMAFYTIMLFAIGCAFVIAYIVSDNLNTAFQGIDDLPAQAKTDMANFNTRYPTVMDYTFLTILVAALAGTLLLVWFLPVNPIVFFVVMIVMTVISGLAGYLANAFIEMQGDTVLGASITNFPIIEFILSNYLVVIMIFGVLSMIVFFAKPGGAE